MSLSHLFIYLSPLFNPLCSFADGLLMMMAQFGMLGAGGGVLAGYNGEHILGGGRCFNVDR